ncbi:hypothetical protein P43SY_005842 [Pythium insidiosum]|uniref:WLM domain-containing protein n=1 Tax=Pythium insidiosum TaxID=114742 RepID=A0AAD5QAX4_PYTIN|nr:hypothetical protein P43SY_005842 [Pythium insidiosum]
MTSYEIREIRALSRGHANRDDAQRLLERIAAQVLPVMAKRRFVVRKLQEFFPKDRHLLGMNVNRGQVIYLRRKSVQPLRFAGSNANAMRLVRPQSRPTTFLPYEALLETMLHELTHMVHGPHNDAFYKYLEELKSELELMMMRGLVGAEGAKFSAAGIGHGMGAKSSKTRPSATAGRGTEETIIVTIVPDNTVGDDVQRGNVDDTRAMEEAAPAVAPAKMSKVQEMREAKAEYPRQGSRDSFGVHSVVTSSSAVALKLSSSEDSEAEDDNGHPGRVKKRKKKRKKKRRAKQSKEPSPPSPTAAAAAAPGAAEPTKPETSPTPRSSLRLKLNELRTPKKPPPPRQESSTPLEGHFEQIKDAYSMEQPDGKQGDPHERRDSDATSTSSPRISRVSVIQLPLPMSQEQKQQKQHQPSLSPRQSTGSFFLSMVDSFQKPSFRSRRSNSSVIADTRYSSRRSPTPHSSIMSPLARQSTSSTRQKEQLKEEDADDSIAVFTHKQYDLDDLDRETRAALEVTYNVYPPHRNQTVDRVSIVMQRRPPPAASQDAEVASAPSSTAPKTPRRELNIDASDECVMDGILAEVQY